MRRHSELTPAAQFVNSALGRPEVLRRMRAQIISRRWHECVGKHLASKSEPERFESGVLWVATTAAVWAQELRMRKTEILSRLNELAGEQLFQDVRFGVRPVSQTGATENVPQEQLVPEQVDVVVRVEALRDVAKTVLGKLKAASKRRSV